MIWLGSFSSNEKGPQAVVKKREKGQRDPWSGLERLEGAPIEGIDLRLSLIIPTHNDAQRLGRTLESISAQEYPHLEVIIVDAGSSDRTADVVQAARHLSPRLYSVPSFDRYEMYNRAIRLATGTYFSILLPGDFFVSQRTIRHMAGLIVQEGGPDLAYCGCFLREASSPPRILYRPLTEELLREGRQPTSLQSCWLRTERVRELGRFDTRYHLRASFDLLCRLEKLPNFRYSSLYRIYLDHERSLVSHKYLLRRSWETLLILWRHYGFWRALFWFIGQNPFKWVAWSWKGMRQALSTP